MHNEGKSFDAEKLIRTLKNTIYKYMASVSKNTENVYINKLDDVVNKYNNIYHSAIKMKSVNEKLSAHIDFIKGNNEKDFKFKVVDNVKI